ncbi:MAG: phosphoribosylformylglycinamidine cyclo-ligase [Acidobacteriia bacterium]|nr:phosphoribosylformylglycinamidine cyclo-ligase [Terriglobia bacterium]
METVLTYKSSGVDLEAAREAKNHIKRLAQKTFTRGVLGEIGGFGGLFSLTGDLKRIEDPVLVASADGVGTKLKIAFAMGIHNTVGQDLVNHCVNDILVHGAQPLFFLDYIASGKTKPSVVAQIVEGMALACKANGCALIGGETAEMPDFYSPDEYDMAGFIVGVVPKKKLINGDSIKAGDILLGLPSSGLHTNGYSLARKIFFEQAHLKASSSVRDLDDTIGETLLEPHRSYLKPLRTLIDRGVIKGLAHITGGGFTENIPRILPRNCQAQISVGTWPVPPIFEVLKRLGNLEFGEMVRTFNMGIGMVVIVEESKVSAAVSQFKKLKEKFYVIGKVIRGEKKVIFV